MVSAGELRHSVIVKEVSGVAKSPMGADVITTKESKLFAKVEPQSANETSRLGFNLNETTYKITVRAAGIGKITEVCYNGTWLNVKGVFSDHLNRYYSIIAVAK